MMTFCLTDEEEKFFVSHKYGKPVEVTDDCPDHIRKSLEEKHKKVDEYYDSTIERWRARERLKAASVVDGTA